MLTGLHSRFEGDSGADKR